MRDILSTTEHSMRLRATTLYLAALLLVGAGGVASTAAQTSDQSRLYQVEVIIFKRQQQDYQEQWPTNIKLGYPSRLVRLQQRATDESETTASYPPFVLLPRNELKLARHATSLARDARFQVLFHQAWRQPLTSPRNAPAILIHGGSPFGRHHELEGSITLSLPQLVQVQTRLWLTEFTLNPNQSGGDWPALPAVPTQAQSDDQSPSSSQTTWPDTDLPETPVPQRIITLEEERKMRLGELHYIDHPLLGMIIQITRPESQ